MYRIHLGCQLDYTALAATPAVFLVQPPARPGQNVECEVMRFSGGATRGEHIDGFGNRCQRVVLQPGRSTLRYDAVIAVSELPDAARADARAVPPDELPPQLLRYTLASRYCETDKLLGFAWQNFSSVPAGWARARAICEWVHHNVEYRRGVSLPHWSAADAISRRQGVCRDRAHAVVALCRAFNMPARYSVAYLPDIDVHDDGLPMDFHAYAEVWFEGGWQVFDPHDLNPRKGRIFLASGLDAADTAFATLYGGAQSTHFKVWADPIDRLGRAVDLRLPRRGTGETGTSVSAIGVASLVGPVPGGLPSSAPARVPVPVPGFASTATGPAPIPAGPTGATPVQPPQLSLASPPPSTAQAA
jgi:transglutaminase-like putative cysteine protease